jgi:hypothetical protein
MLARSQEELGQAGSFSGRDLKWNHIFASVEFEVFDQKRIVEGIRLKRINKAFWSHGPRHAIGKNSYVCAYIHRDVARVTIAVHASPCVRLIVDSTPPRIHFPDPWRDQHSPGVESPRPNKTSGVHGRELKWSLQVQFHSPVRLGTQ